MNTPVPIGPVLTPYPTADIPTPPPSVVALQESVARGEALDLGWIIRLINKAEGLFEGAEKLADGFTAIQAEVNIPWYANAPFDILMHFLLGSFLGCAVYLLISGTLFTVESNWAERLPGGNSASALRGWGIRLFSGLFAACVAFGSHLWWDGYSLTPSKVGSWLFWLAMIGSTSLVAFVLGWTSSPKEE